MATDEWTFQIRFPTPVDGQQLLELRQARPSKESDHPHSTSNDDERVSLLLQNSTTVCSTGWRLTSPFWSIQSSILLSLTYFPAWQALPEYTTHACSSCCCCHVEGCCGTKQDFLTEYFTVEDVVKVQMVEAHQIRGIGMCRAVQLHLRPLLYESYPIPPQLQSAWETHLEHMEHNQNELSEQPSNDVSSKNSHAGPVLTFCLSSTQTDPPLLWKVEIPALQTAIAMETITVFEGKLQAAGSGYFPTHTYVNGFQSWTFSGSIPRGAPQPQSAMPDRVSRAFNAGGAPPPTDATILTSSSSYVPPNDFVPTYISDFFTCITSDGETTEPLYPPLDETGGPACVMGWLSQRQQFGIITADCNLERLQMHASCQGQILLPHRRIVTDWAYVQLTTPHSYDEEPMVYFLHAAAAYNEARPMANLLTGWCSWYVFYQNISETILRENFVTLKEMRTHVPTNVAVVDDGYMTAWGDWDSCKPGQFPSSLGVVADDIRKNQMRPGLWLAPFAADKHSVLTKEHPEWIIRNNGGLPANSSNCGKFFYGLDATNPAVRRHVHDAIERAVKQWGYSVLKIDFLYAACLEGSGRYDLSMSRAQAMHVAMQTIREAAGSSTFLIGCGCPIASGIGIVDAMRVSADTGPAWYPQFPFPWWDHGTLPSLKAMIRNSITRAPLGHRWWHNDPDCLMLGNHTSLTDVEVASAASIVAMTCGMLLLSDDLPKVSLKRMNILSKIFPLTGIPAVVLDLHSTKDGIPRLLRLWATDKFDVLDSFRSSMSLDEEFDHNAEATFFARQASFYPDQESVALNERKRTCIHVTKGLGTWTIVSISNWADSPVVSCIPPAALLPLGGTLEDNEEASTDSFSSTKASEPGRHGYHTLAFWSCKYNWIPDHRKNPEQTISRRLNAHETEIYHIKPVTPENPQYIGGNLHFSCGKEVRSFYVNFNNNRARICLETNYYRNGSILMYIPRTTLDKLQITVTGKPESQWSAVGNIPRISDNGSHQLAGRVVQIPIEIFADKRPHDGEIEIEY
ncbi:hypothetical protein FisN_16Hh109 [Fistulifera solaris]|uniref:Alpha-galactosidase n=1 Tax=Fistulifera solaris TaxID=1519565 RepID=A0A1Z5KSY9_FISSO|nr:hypothetical protein FisN_16Hh109 [Fistulifera solaris]|eukprot:GAX29450.1 hypothetical protein FisN_16Hh109 [Fistulifera solaris]